MEIPAALVKELRVRTNAGMMECKKALVETNGEIELAVEYLRKSGAAKADKKSGRIAADGLVTIQLSNDCKKAAIVETNCETDFVARDNNFVDFANEITKLILENNDLDLSKFDESRKALITKIGENINIRRAFILDAKGIIGSYVHSGRIGVLVELMGGTETLAKDIAMHIAASKPVVISPEEVSQSLIDTEKEIFKAQAKESGKPDEIIQKMVEGRIKKFLAEVSLLGQPFVKDTDITVGDLLKKANAKVISFTRYEVGEGIEKKEEDFAKEVMAQAKAVTEG